MTMAACTLANMPTMVGPVAPAEAVPAGRSRHRLPPTRPGTTPHRPCHAHHAGRPPVRSRLAALTASVYGDVPMRIAPEGAGALREAFGRSPVSAGDIVFNADADAQLVSAVTGLLAN